MSSGRKKIKKLQLVLLLLLYCAISTTSSSTTTVTTAAAAAPAAAIKVKYLYVKSIVVLFQLRAFFLLDLSVYYL